MKTTIVEQLLNGWTLCYTKSKIAEKEAITQESDEFIPYIWTSHGNELKNRRQLPTERLFKVLKLNSCDLVQ